MADGGRGVGGRQCGQCGGWWLEAGDVGQRQEAGDNWRQEGAVTEGGRQEAGDQWRPAGSDRRRAVGSEKQWPANGGPRQSSTGDSEQWEVTASKWAPMDNGWATGQ